MCILFAYINNNASDDGEYQVIVAMNRDEFIDRPTLPAHFWNDHCISGLDALPGREGGTWFGVSSKFAKIGALLNISLPVLDTSKRPRGHLVPDYLQSDQDAAAYIETVAKQQNKFNPLNLVLFERRVGYWTFYYLKTDSTVVNSPRHLTAGIEVISNSALDQPWQKVIKGREKFEQIVSQHRHKCDSAELIKDLISMLSDCASNLPDPVLESQLTSVLTGPGLTTQHQNILIGPELQAKRSAIFVSLYNASRYFGTRTHSLVLIDKSGHCEYVEQTMSCDAINDIRTNLSASAHGNTPITGKRSSDWKTTRHQFNFA